MAKTNIGRVSVVPKDEYSSTENYKRLDVVSDNGSMYISKKDNNQGNPLTDKNWWFKAVEKGEVGPQGEKPVNGVDYNTPEEKEEFKNDVVNKATEEVKGNIANIETKAIENYNKNADKKLADYDTNASNKLKTYNDNTTTKLSEYNTNANSKVKEYNSNATQKTNTFNENATSKVSEYNTNASTQTETFNTNATNKTNDFNSNATTKTNDFNNNYDEKMADINDASTSIEAERKISDGKYARALKTQVTDVESTQIYAENDVVDDLVINGVELTQETREGYNEIQNEVETSSMGGVDIIRNSDGSVTLNGTATENITLYYSTKSITLNGKYIFYLIGKNNNINLQGIEDGSIMAYLKYASSSNYIERSYEADTVLSSFFSYISIGKTFNNETYYPMITKGEEVKPYEEYGASPSLDYPSEIQVAKEQNISIEGKNKCRGWMNTTSTAVYGNALYIKADLKPNTKYTISFLTPTFEAEYYIAEELTSNWFAVINNGKRQSYTFTTKADISNAYKEYNGEYGYILFKNAIATPSPANFSDVMLVEGDTDVPYEPYYGHDVNIPLTNNSICNYFDVIDRENNRQYKIVQELILNGDETDWSREDTAVGTRFFKPLQNSIISNTNNPYALCTHFKLSYSGGTYNVVGNLFAIYKVTAGTNRLAFGSFTDISTVDEWKAKLKELYEAGKPVKIYYVAESSTTNPLSEEVKQELDKFKLYDGLNNVSIDNGTLSFKYNKSLLRAFKEQSELSASLLERIQALEQAQIDSATENLGGN